jgi:ADP-heptose:LPS heptosyltransferase
MAGILKKEIPGCFVLFLGKVYTRPLIDACEFVDQFIDWDEVSSIQHPASSISALNALKVDIIIHVFPDKKIQKLAKAAKIPLRIGTSHRWYSWLYCNKLIHYSRKNSNLHEAQLNLKLLEPLGITKEYSLAEIPNYYGLSKLTTSPIHHGTTAPIHHGTTSPLHHGTIAPMHQGPMTPFNLILHPKSKGSAREWGLENFSKLIDLLPAEKFSISVTGTKEEGALMKEFLDQHRGRVQDMTGKLSLTELLTFINSCDGLIAASTGPLHIAAALGKRAIGIYAPMRPIFPERWAPLGKNATYLVLDKKCEDCRKTCDCACIRAITPEQVVEKLKI